MKFPFDLRHRIDQLKKLFLLRPKIDLGFDFHFTKKTLPRDNWRKLFFLGVSQPCKIVETKGYFLVTSAKIVSDMPKPYSLISVDKFVLNKINTTTATAERKILGGRILLIKSILS